MGRGAVTGGIERATGARWRRRGRGFDNEFGGERNYDGPSRPASVCVLHAKEIVISSRGKRVTLGGARSAPSIDRARKRQTSDILGKWRSGEALRGVR